MILRLAVAALMGCAAGTALAHEDLDLGIESIQLDRKCRAQITLKNYGRELPESFYMAVRPAYIALAKGAAREELKSLRMLDKKRALLPTGGTLRITSRATYAANPEPFEAKILLEGEFLDYGSANDRVYESMDCVPGQGQIAGAKIPDTQPDIVVREARIDPETCELRVSFGNLSSIGLDAGAWEPESGVFLMQLALPAHERQPDIPLLQLDPERRFTRPSPQLDYTAPLSKVRAEKWRVGLWQVLNERDFPNNQSEIPVPEKCRAPLPLAEEASDQLTAS